MKLTKKANMGKGAMKKICSVIAIITISLLSLSQLYASGAEQNTSQSAEFVKTLNRNASIDADSVYYNPAGTAIMPGGVYVYLSNQTVIKPVIIKRKAPNQKNYEGDKSAYYSPNIYIVYNREKVGPGSIAASLGFLGIGGKDGANYNDGLPVLDDRIAAVPNPNPSSYYKCYSAYYSFQVNLAYAFLNKALSISAGYRFIHAMNRFDGKLKSNGTTLVTDGLIDAEQRGMSHSFIAGIGSQPIKDLLIGIKYEWNSILKLETDADDESTLATADAPFLANNYNLYKTLPMSLSMGISYSIIGIKMEYDFTLFLNELAEWNGLESQYDNGYETGFGIDYTLPMVPLNLGLGYLYSKDGGNTSTRNQYREGLDSHAIGFGLTYSLLPTLQITVAYSFTYYVPVDVDSSPTSTVEFNVMGHDIAIGLQYKAM